MGDRSDELLSIWLNDRIEHATRLTARHQLLTVCTVALVAALLSFAGLVIQHRVTPAMLAFDAALCLPLLLRHRSVLACFGLVGLAALAQWLISGPQLADVAVLIAVYWVCLDGNLRSIGVALTLAEAGAVMLALRWEQQRFKYWVGVTGLVVAAAALGLMIRQRRALLESLHERAARLERERDQQGQLGAAAERARIAREMHDIVSHNLVVMIALADGALYTLDAGTERARGAIERVSATGRQALLEMRRLLGVLREDSDHELLAPQPGLERLDELLARVEAAGIPVTIALEGDPHELSAGVQLTLFRVAQEALTNTLKHASRPTTAHLALRCRGDQVELEVTDAGPVAGVQVAVAPPAAVAGGRGVTGMRERVSAYGGQLEVGPLPDGGWRVHLRLHPDTASAPQSIGVSR